MSTSFRNIFRHGLATRIEIPIIQRDYAQGRKDAAVTRIRNAFLRVLRKALAENKPAGLDFVYGELENGRLVPFDGQQRLTTLFLLHWYLAARSDVPDDECAFLAGFTYRTRFSARHFCEKLVSQRPPFPAPAVGRVADQQWLSHWLTDQHWYAGAWKHDPTIQSMLVALDAIHDLFATDDEGTCRVAWNRLVAEDQPAITFDFLSLEDVGRPDELYIKMNSRGKPLTRFEHFKADFEKTLGEESKDTRAEFVRKIDQDWSDLLWPLHDSGTGQRNDDTIIDDEFLRLFHFIGDIVIQRHGLPLDSALFVGAEIEWAERIYGKANSRAADAQCYMMDVLDSLHAEFKRREMKKASDFTDWFECFFSEKGYRQGRVAIFGKVDLFADCCAKYGDVNGQVRAFPLARTLLLFAFLEYLILMEEPHRTARGGQCAVTVPPERPEPGEVARRLRTVRNLISASENQIRTADFAALLDETAEYMRGGDLGTIKTFHARQIEEEKNKVDFLRKHSGDAGLEEALHRLEDHRLLRGCLAVFDLNVDPATFIRRAELFHDVFPEDSDAPVQQICAALLACGDYWQRTKNGRYQFGSPRASQHDTWRNLLTNANIANISAALLAMLDTIDKLAEVSIHARLQAVSDGYLARQERARSLSWRYYLVKYPSMRSGDSGIYLSSTGNMGFGLCMLNRKQLNSNYRDPYLLAVIEESGAREGHDVEHNWHYGWDCYHPEQRWIALFPSGYKVISCRQDGFQLQAPEDAAQLAVFNAIRQKYKVGDDLVLRVPQTLTGDAACDEEDRIEAAASLLKELIAGLSALASNNLPQAAGTTA